MASLTSEFKPGDPVSYIPRHAHGDLGHPDVEHGVVTSINDVFVFVRYGAELHAKATSPHDLRKQFPKSGS